MSKLRFISFWGWLIKGSGGKSGLRRLADIWMLVHISVGLTLACLIDKPLSDCASSVLLPLAGIIVALSFAWVGNAQALLLTSEMEDVAEKHDGGFVEYVHVYQMAILLILVCLVSWCVAGLSVFDSAWPTPKNFFGYFCTKSALFMASSISLRECWHVVLGAQTMLVMQREIKRSRKTKAGKQ
jgi:hypothetical protein